MFRTIERYEETGLGLPYPVVLLDSAEEEIDDVTGEVVGVSVPDLEQLVLSVAIVRVLTPIQLDGQEVRFIRQVIGMNATAFAEELSIDKATYSRWENGKQICGEWVEKQVRRIAVIKLAGKVPCLSLDPTTIVGMRIRKAPPGWVPTLEMRRMQAWDAVTLPEAA